MARKQIRAIFPGSFDPPTFAHLDVLQQARELFDVTIVIGHNPTKTPMLTQDERAALFHDVMQFKEDVHLAKPGESIVDTARILHPDVIIRGIRGPRDVEPEQEYAHFIDRASMGAYRTVYFMTPARYQHVSSTMVRSIMAIHGWREKKLLADYVPALALQHLIRRHKAA